MALDPASRSGESVAIASWREARRGGWIERTGDALLYGGPLLTLGAFALLAELFPQIEDNTPLALALAAMAPVAFMASLYGAFRLAWLGKQIQARARATALAADARPPVLYLRPFSADESPRAAFRRLLAEGIWLRFASVEEQLALVLEPVGPLIAIGAPDEALPTPGAVRRYVTDTDWKSLVSAWLGESRLVVVRPGLSEGVWWELRQVVERGRPERLLILATRMRRRTYAHFADLVRARLGKSLPPFEAIARWGMANGFIRFDGEWRPSFLPLRGSLLRGDVALKLVAPLHHALRPVFDGLGLPWSPAPISRMKLFLLVVVGLVAGAFAAMVLFDTFLR
jgi:hypothetical protein